MPKKTKPRPKDALSPEELIGILDEYITRKDPDEAEKEMREWLNSPSPSLEDFFGKED